MDLFPRFKMKSAILSRSGFTLIELLVVVAIISLLAAIAIPNFLMASTRAKVTKAKSDMRVLAEALEMYHADNNMYPQAAAILPRKRLEPLTTPIGYLSSLPVDPFGSRLFRGVYRYGAMDLIAASRWMMASAGPDLIPSTDPIEFYPGYEPGLFVGAVPDFDYMIYDPTNGAISRGDVIRVSDFNLE
jgi:type II secretion system protein G